MKFNLEFSEKQLKNLSKFMGRVDMTGMEAYAWLELMQIIQRPGELNGPSGKSSKTGE